MSQIFPKWTNRLPAIIALSVVVLVLSVIGFFWYYGSPKYTDVGYRPVQPVAYSHKLHAGDLGMDCRYCHSSVERSPVANVPPTQTCMNCHKLILPQSEKLLKVRESWSTGRPIPWVRVHELPDYAYFNHSAHLNAGVGCASCHGNVAQMEQVTQSQPLSMSWCLDCHRNPDLSLRPPDQVTNMTWTPPSDQLEFARRAKAEKHINPPTDCSGCHR
ncbi:MAG: cytochrome c3 family protein [candidate division Zixibacteria bacterium]|nr:cytochrome c3 family protein [candidate division Zixibacteria bacterium]